MKKRYKVRLKKSAVRQFIKGRMVKKPMKMIDMGRLLGVSSGYWTQCLKGYRYPGPAVRRRLMRLMGVPDKDWKKLFQIIPPAKD